MQEAHFIGLLKQKIDESIFELPDIHPLSNDNILVMSFIEGISIEQAAQLPQDVRNYIVRNLFTLFFNELFDLKLMQTDPNFANYLYYKNSQKIGLLDFGATREISDNIASGYLYLFKALYLQDKTQIEQAARSIGFFKTEIDGEYLAKMLNVFRIASEPLRLNQEYDFATCTIAASLRHESLSINKQKDQWHTPPVDALFIHRKIAGLYLLAKRLNAKVNVHKLLKPYL